MGILRTRIYLQVPFGLNKQAKALGAEWDPVYRCWFVTTPEDAEKVRALTTNHKDPA
jgi:hypothetical protein